MEVYLWILTGLVAFILPIFTMIVAGNIRSLNIRIQEFVKAIEQLNLNNAKNIEQIKTLYTNNENTTNDLADHESRIRCLETKCRNL